MGDPLSTFRDARAVQGDRGGRGRMLTSLGDERSPVRSRAPGLDEAGLSERRCARLARAEPDFRLRCRARARRSRLRGSRRDPHAHAARQPDRDGGSAGDRPPVGLLRLTHRNTKRTLLHRSDLAAEGSVRTSTLAAPKKPDSAFLSQFADRPRKSRRASFDESLALVRSVRYCPTSI